MSTENLRDVQQWGMTKIVTAALVENVEAGALERTLTGDWRTQAEAGGYVVLGEPRISSEPRWWIEDETMFMPMGDGKPDAFEYRVIGEVFRA